MIHPHFTRVCDLLTSSDTLYLPFLCNLLASYAKLFLASKDDKADLNALKLSAVSALSRHLQPCAVLPLILLYIHVRNLREGESDTDDSDLLSTLYRLDLTEPLE
jgi:hypothetical protein